MSLLDLLPYYARFTEILDRLFPYVAASLVTELEQQFRGLARFKKQLNIDSRLRNARFLGDIFLIIYKKNITNQQQTVSNQSNTKSVSFANINIREYEITICDHPETSFGQSILLGWMYNENLSINMNTYELIKDAKGRRDYKDLSLSRWERENLLFEFGFSISEINSSSAVKKPKRSRRKRNIKMNRLIGLEKIFPTGAKFCQEKKYIKIQRWRGMNLLWNSKNQ